MSHQIGGYVILFGFPALCIALWYQVFFSADCGRYGRGGTALIAAIATFITIHLILRGLGIDDGIAL